MKDVLCSKGCGKMVRINDSSVGGVCGDCVANSHSQVDGSVDKSATEKESAVSVDMDPTVNRIPSFHEKTPETGISQDAIDKGMEKLEKEVVKTKKIKLSQVSKEHTEVELKKPSRRKIILTEFSAGKSREEILVALKVAYPDLTDKKARSMMSVHLSALKMSILKKE